MSDHKLNAAAVRENSNSLAAVLGIEVDQAEELLNVSVLITIVPEDNAGQKVATQICELLARTLRGASTGVDAAKAVVEVVIGQAASRSALPKIWVSADSNGATISRQPVPFSRIDALHPVLSLVVACYAAGAAIRLATGDALPFPLTDPIVLDLKDLGITSAVACCRIDLAQAYLAGAGAIGNAFLWALRWFDVHGQLDIVDFDFVKQGNLNRQLWFTELNVNSPKAECLATHAQPFFPHLTLVPRVGRLESLPERNASPSWLQQLIVAVDSRLVRRSLQMELPGEVFDASTTDIREVVLHFNKQPTQKACLGCIYPTDDAEEGRTRDIAGALGVSVEDVRKGVITPSAAKLIIARYPDRDLTADSLEGEAYDSLFKALCAKAALKSSEGRQVFAPFAFISALAGAMLAIETVRRLSGESPTFNLWKISPWSPFLTKLQRQIPANPSCVVCGSSIYRQVMQQVWS